MTETEGETRCYVRPGQLFLAPVPALVETVLGSCVAVTMHAPARELGALCHAMLPEGPLSDPRTVPGALDAMLKHFTAQGVARSALVVKLFGGGDMFHSSEPRQTATIGRQNIDEARRLLHEAGLRIAAEDVGGAVGRRIYFRSRTGEVFVRRNPVAAQPVAADGAARVPTGSGTARLPGIPGRDQP